MTTSYDPDHWYSGDLKVVKAAITNIVPAVGTGFLGCQELDPRMGETAVVSTDPANPTCWVDWTAVRWVNDGAFQSTEPLRQFLLQCYIQSQVGARWVQRVITEALKDAMEAANGTEDKHLFQTDLIQPPGGYTEAGTGFEVSVFTVPVWAGITTR